MSPAQPSDDALAAKLAAAGSAGTLGSVQTDEVILPCRRVQAIEVQVVDEKDQPLEDVLVELYRGTAQAISNKTGVQGWLRFDGLAPGDYQVGLPRLDGQVWQVIAQQPLPVPASFGEAAWGSPQNTEQRETVHNVEQGDCIASLGFAYGLLPRTIWDHGANSGLKQKRGDLHVLQPGEQVVIPERQAKKVSATTGNRYVVRRLGVPEILRIRFLDFADKPRKNIPYLLNVEAGPDGDSIIRKGATNGDGLLEEPISPGSTRGTVVLGEGADAEIVNVLLGHLNPLDEISGIQARLNALRYDCGGQAGLLDDPTKRALRDFQSDYGLTVSGEIDGPTRARLQELFGN